MSASNPVSIINEEYFGNDKHRNYLKDDFFQVLQDIIQRDVIMQVLIECFRKRSNKKENKDKIGKVVSVTYGDFDQDNASFLSSIFEAYEKGVMIDVRQLLADGEMGAGGKFIKDIMRLTADNFIDYYKNSKNNKTIIPNLLTGHFLENNKNGYKLSAGELLSQHYADIEDAVQKLIKKAEQLNNRDYFRTVKDYQALKFHKDHQPDKYDIREAIEYPGVFDLHITTRHDKAKVDPVVISEFLNSFADIIGLYQRLVGEGTSFFGSNWPLETYVQRTVALFDKKIPTKTQQNIINDIVKNLDASLNIVGLQHSKMIS